ncbi:MAG TPA: hypothetical protein VIT64_14890 [Ilumatobacteraceae bacterium]
MGSQLTGVAGVNDLFAIDANPAIPLVMLAAIFAFAGAIVLCRGRTDRQI